MRRMTMLVLLLTTAFVLAGTSLLAGVPETISYQGRLTDADGNPVNGPQQITFSLYDTESPAAPPHWSSGPLTIQVDSGLFSCTLGSVGNPLPPYIFSLNILLYLGIAVGSDPELTPRAQLTSSPWSLYSGLAENALNSDMVDDLHAEDFASAGHAHLDLVDTLSNQTIWGQKSFINRTDLANGDILIDPDDNALMLIDRDVSEGTLQSWGILLELRNSASKPSAGVQANAYVDDSYATGVIGLAGPHTNAGTTGRVYGVQGLAFYGLVGYGGYFGCNYSLNSYGVYATCNNSTGDYGGYFFGNVHTTGTSTKGLGGFVIDHPDDPENEYLAHADVSSPDRMNIYNGNAVLDAGGKAVIQLPSYFESLNEDFRYQLTCVGGFAPVFVAEEISGNQFLIAGGEPGLKVSWQVTGVRKDALAKAMPLEVEKAKATEDQGKYQNPEVFGRALEDAVDYKHIKPRPDAAQTEQGNR